MFEWIEIQIGRFTNFISDAKEDIAEFDEHLQEEIVKYRNKQCGKAAIFGAIVGIAAFWALQGIIRSF